MGKEHPQLNPTKGNYEVPQTLNERIARAQTQQLHIVVITYLTRCYDSSYQQIQGGYHAFC